MKNVKSVFRNLEKQLRNASWFNDGWEIYNRGEYLQLYKSNWYNGNQGGVHFETYIEAPQMKSKSFPLCMHAEEDCPSQQDFIQRFLEMEEKQINSWKGYKVIGSGYHICEKKLPLNFKNLEQRLYEEFNRLRKLATSVDQILDSV